MKYLTPITDKDQKQLNDWIEKVRLHEHGMFKWADALWKLKESGLWKAKAKSWSAFCFEEFGYSRDKASRLVLAAQSVDSLNIIRQTTGEEIEVPKTISAAVQRRTRLRSSGDASAEMSNSNLSEPIPVTSVIVKENPQIPMDLRAFADFVWKSIDWVTHHETLTFDGGRKLQSVLTQSDKFRKPNVLPSMETVMSPKGKRYPTLEEVVLFCNKTSIASTNAEWFLAKMAGNGWTNNGKPVRDWMGTLTQWKIQGCLGTDIQKRVQQNGHAPPQTAPTLRQKILREHLADTDRFLERNNL